MVDGNLTRMKKLSAILALLAVVGMVFVSGCGQSSSTPPPSETPSTNAPAH